MNTEERLNKIEEKLNKHLIDCARSHKWSIFLLVLIGIFVGGDLNIQTIIGLF